MVFGIYVNNVTQAWIWIRDPDSYSSKLGSGIRLCIEGKLDTDLVARVEPFHSLPPPEVEHAVFSPPFWNFTNWDPYAYKDQESCQPIGLKQRVLNDLQRTRLSRRRIIWLLPHPLSPLLSASSAETEKNRKYAEERGGKWWKRSQIIRRREIFVIYIIQYSLGETNSQFSALPPTFANLLCLSATLRHYMYFYKSANQLS